MLVIPPIIEGSNSYYQKASKSYLWFISALNDLTFFSCSFDKWETAKSNWFKW